MNKITQIFVLAFMSATTAPESIFANFQQAESEPVPRNFQIYSDQNQDIDEEQSFMKRSENQYDQFRQPDSDVFIQDQEMYQENYDPNERNYPGQPQMQYKSQEELLEEEKLFGNQGKYPSRYQTTPTRNYTYEVPNTRTPNYPSSRWENYSEAQPVRPSRQKKINQEYPVIEYMLGKDGKWRETSRRNSNDDMSYHPQQDDKRRNPYRYDNQYMKQQSHHDYNQGWKESEERYYDQKSYDAGRPSTRRNSMR